MTTPRRIRLDLMTPAETAIRAAHAAIEAMPADVRLTQAGEKMNQALDLVASYIDEQMRGVSLDSQHGQHLGCGGAIFPYQSQAPGDPPGGEKCARCGIIGRPLGRA